MIRKTFSFSDLRVIAKLEEMSKINKASKYISDLILRDLDGTVLISISSLNSTPQIQNNTTQPTNNTQRKHVLDSVLNI